MLELDRLVGFCRTLREHGLSVTPAEVVTAAAAMQIIDNKDRDEVFLSLRNILTTSVDDFPIFESLFATFWSGPDPAHLTRSHHRRCGVFSRKLAHLSIR
jgi:uncharacterized protein with von Willebrand factor type A (vWA) domain